MGGESANFGWYPSARISYSEPYNPQKENERQF
jgi:hypothetical protein